MNKNNKDIDIIHINIRSLKKQFNQLLVLLNANFNIDIIILTEINIKNEELPLFKINGYNISF